jgi:CRISPR system Cascade subunit CasC
MFVQLHALTPYPATLLNRDEAGFAKRLPFGGVTRTRVSSQCLKYHWRNFDGENAIQKIDAPETYRSQETFRREITKPLVEEDYPAPLARAATVSLMEQVVSGKTANKSDVKSAITAESTEEIHNSLHTGQVTVLGAPEMRYLRSLAVDMVSEAEKDFPAFWENDGVPEDVDVGDVADAIRKSIDSRELKKNLKAIKHDELGLGLNAAMFGRMATSDILARGDAAVHVAHAFTTHASEVEDDYFTAVDELRRDEPEETGELGAAHINSQELTSGLFYSYVAIDVPLLVSNITGAEQDEWMEVDRSLAAEVTRRLALVMTTVSPGAKLGSTAPYSRAQFLLAETGTTQPRTLANAFQEAVETKGDVLVNSYDALSDYLEDLNGMYGVQTDRHLAAMRPTDRLLNALHVHDTLSVPEVAEWTADQIEGGA